MTILDIDGGKQLSRNYTSPGRLLVMGPAGDLYIRNEINDKPAVDHYNQLFDEDTRRRMFGGAGGEEFGAGPRGMQGGGRGFRGGER
jgi:hypothetical protein